MISVITAVHNQVNMNKLFWENLQKCTYNDFELIIIDNASSDGSAEFFESIGARVIRNDGNYSYPYCQNQGIKIAKYDNFAFLNNDIIVSKYWDKHLLESMEVNGLEVATSCGLEHLENKKTARKLRKKWAFIKRLIGFFGYSYKNLALMHRLMYSDWDKFCNDRFTKFRHKIKEGFVGHCVVMKKSAIDKVGIFDERRQDGDFDLWYREKKRQKEIGDIKSMSLCLDAYNHHYIRLSMNIKYPPVKDKANLCTAEDKWSKEEVEELNRIKDTDLVI